MPIPPSYTGSANPPSSAKPPQRIATMKDSLLHMHMAMFWQRLPNVALLSPEGPLTVTDDSCTFPCTFRLPCCHILAHREMSGKSSFDKRWTASYGLNGQAERLQPSQKWSPRLQPSLKPSPLPLMLRH